MAGSDRRSSSLAVAVVILVAACGSGGPTPSAGVPTTPAVATPTVGATVTAGATDATTPTGTATDTAPPADTAAPTDTSPPTDTATPTSGASPGSTGDIGDVPVPDRPAEGIVMPDWVPVLDAQRRCQMNVPPDWQTDLIPGTATFGAGVEALAGLTSAPVTDWAAYKAGVRQALISGHVAAIDTDQMLLIHSPDVSTDLTWALVTNEGTYACSVLATVKANWVGQHTETLLSILESLQPAS